MTSVGRRMVEIAEMTVPSVTAQETYKRMQAGEPIVVLDIREPDEQARGVIEGAVLLPRGRIEGRVEELIPDKDACIIAHCMGTGRAALSGQTLKSMGYTNVSYMAPGFNAWKESGLPITTPAA